MKALILDNLVVDIVDTPFEVHNSLVWEDCDESVKLYYFYENGNYVPNRLTEEEIALAVAQANKELEIKTSGNAKLLSLGLTQEEATALTGFCPTN